MKRFPARHLRGFTLLELMIAIAIFALVGLATYRMFDSVMRSDAVIRSHEQGLRELARGIWTLERDLAQVSPRPIRDAYGDSRPALLSANESGAEASLEFTRSGWRNPVGTERSQLQRVQWRVAGDQLERTYWSVLDQDVDSQPRVQKVLPGVTSLQLRYLNQEGEWLSQWPPQMTGGSAEQSLALLPQAVEVRLQHRRYGELIRLLRLPDAPAASVPKEAAGERPEVTP